MPTRKSKPLRRPRVTTLVPADDKLPPAAQVRRFETFYCNHFDAKMAACQAGLMPEMGEKLYKDPKVRERIDKKMLLVDVEIARMKAKANALTVPLLDVALMEEVKSKKNGHIRVRAIELGYRRTGLIRDGEFIGGQGGGSGPGHVKTYGQIHTTTQRRTITEEVIHSSEAKEDISTEKSPEIAPVTVRLMQPVEDY